MYFKSRAEAGKQLANQLDNKYNGNDTAVIALSDGGVVVGLQIASALICPLTLLLIEPIDIPGEHDPVAVINQDGIFTYNHLYSSGQLEDFDMEYHHYIEQLKVEKLHDIHHLLGKGGLINKRLLRKKNIILVSDGMSSGFSLEAAVDYLKPIKIKRMIVATPLASVGAVDRMHILTDEIHCLSIIENYIGTNHYYEDNQMPGHDKIIQVIEDIISHWV